MKEKWGVWTMLLVLLLGIGCLAGSFVTLYWDELARREAQKAATPRITAVIDDGSLLTVKFEAAIVSRCDSLVVEISSRMDFDILWPIGGGMVDDWRAGYAHVLVQPPQDRGWVRLVVESCRGERRAVSKPVPFSVELRRDS